jgi:hypothetical protein
VLSRSWSIPGHGFVLLLLSVSSSCKDHSVDEKLLLFRPSELKFNYSYFPDLLSRRSYIQDIQAILLSRSWLVLSHRALFNP